MSLLEEVIAGASSDVPLPGLMRQLKVLAARTGVSTLREWVDHELEGYPSSDDLPAYRGPFHLTPLAHFLGPLGRELKNFQLQPAMFPEEFRDSQLFKMWMIEPVAELEHLSKKQTITRTWPADGEVLFNVLHSKGKIKMISRDFVLAEVRCIQSPSIYVGALDAVRNKVLDLALEIEAVAPAAGQPDAPDEVREQVASVVQLHFHGPTNVAVGDHANQIVLSLPSAGDVDGLLRYLAAAGVPPALLTELARAAADDEADAADGPRRHERVKSWFAKTGTELGSAVASGLLVEALASFIG